MEYRDLYIVGIPFRKEDTREDLAREIKTELSQFLKTHCETKRPWEIEMVDIPMSMRPGFCNAFVKFVDHGIHTELVPIINGIFSMRNKTVHARLSDNVHRGIRATRFVAWHKENETNVSNTTNAASRRISPLRFMDNGEEIEPADIQATIQLSSHTRIKQKLEEKITQLEQICKSETEKNAELQQKISKIEDDCKKEKEKNLQLQRENQEVLKQNNILKKKLEFDQKEIEDLRKRTSRAAKILTGEIDPE
jgi:hypothetical protein